MGISFFLRHKSVSCSDMEVDKVANMVVDMEVDRVANVVADMVADKVSC